MTSFRGTTTFAAFLLANIALSIGARTPISLNYHMFEEVTPGSQIGDLKNDAGLSTLYTVTELAALRFRFLMQPRINVTLDTESGMLMTNGRLDREVMCESEQLCEAFIDVVVQPIDFFQIIKITLVIEDINDNQPMFEETDIFLQVLETVSVGTSLSLPSAFDRDSPENGIRSYELYGTLQFFELFAHTTADNSTNLRMVLQRALDREMLSEYHLELVAFDSGKLTGKADIHVEVLDANDNDPRFESTTYDVIVLENIPVGTVIVRVQAIDPDLGPNGEVLYHFSTRTSERHGDVFSLDPITGDVSVTGILDRESYDRLHLAIIAEDAGENTLPAEAMVTVSIQDVNDNAPDVRVNTLTGSDVAEVIENSAPGTFVAHLSVTDRDIGENGRFDCFLDHANFALSKLYDTEYQIVTTTELDRESVADYDVVIECIDEGDTRLTSTAELNIVVTDYNDNAPQFSQTLYQVSLDENNPIGLNIVDVQATDKDDGENAYITYAISQEAKNYFDINRDTGAIHAITSLDREATETLHFVVYANDAGTPSLTGSANVTVTLLDVNDEAPVFKPSGYSFSVPENEPIDTVVGHVTAVDEDRDDNRVEYRIESNDDFVIDPSSGIITTARVFDRETVPMYHLSIIARDVNNPQLMGSASVTINIKDTNDNDPVFTFPTILNNTVQVPNNAAKNYAVTRIFADDPDIGDNGKIQYTIVSGNDDELFLLGIEYGILTTARDMSELKVDKVTLTIAVHDSGEAEQRSSLAVLYVELVEPLMLKAGGLQQQEGFLSRDSFTIVVSLAAVSAAVTLMLILIIVLVYKRIQLRKTQYGTYNCRKEAQRIFQNTSKSPDDDTLTKDTSHMNGSMALAESMTHYTPNDQQQPHQQRPQSQQSQHREKQVSFDLNGDSHITGRPLSQESLPSSIDSQSLKHPQAQSTAVSIATSPNTSGQAAMHVKDTEAEHRALEMARLLELLRRRECETTSVTSEEDSTTDSGRGGSDRDDSAEHAHRNNGLTVQKRERKRGRYATRLSPDSQIVPSSSNRTTPNSTLSHQLSLPHSEHRRQHRASPHCIEQARNNDLTASDNSMRSHESVTSSHKSTPGAPGCKTISPVSTKQDRTLPSSDNSGMTSLIQSFNYTPIIEKLTSDLAMLQAHNARRGSDSTESVRSDAELLDDDDVTSAVNSQLECAFINSTNPGNTPMAVWRKPGSSPGAYYSSYLDYTCPRKVHLKTFQIDLDKTPSRGQSTVEHCACADTANGSGSFGSTPKIICCEQSNEPKPYSRNGASQQVHVTHLDETECTGNGMLYSTADISECLTSHTNNAISDGRESRGGSSCASSQSSKSSLANCKPKPIITSQRAIKTTQPTTDAAQTGYKTPNTKSYLTPATSQFRLPSIGRRTPSLSPTSGQSTLEVTDTSSSLSGSHVTDPHELCKRIDQIFFNESEV